MVKVTFKPWEEIVIHEVTKFKSVEEFIEQKVAGFPKGVPIEPMLWAKGILFLRAPFPPTSDVIKEQLHGVIHYSSVEYTVMEKYEKSITQGDITIAIADVSNNEAFSELIEAVKNQEKKSS